MWKLWFLFSIIVIIAALTGVVAFILFITKTEYPDANGIEVFENDRQNS